MRGPGDLPRRRVRVQHRPTQGRVVCPNFGHPVRTSTFTKYEFLQVKNSLATIENDYNVRKLRMTEVRAGCRRYSILP